MAIFVYITCPSKKSAKEIAIHLLKKRLIACANIFPINSIYWWKDKIAEANTFGVAQQPTAACEKEFVLIVKTLKKNYQKIKEEVEKIHPYKIPCIAKINVDLNKKYLKWIKKEVE